MGPRNATRVKNLNGMEQLIIDIHPKRSESFVHEKKNFDVTSLVKYIEKNKKDGKHITYFHAFVTAIAKVLYNREKLNRFIQNRHVFRHNNVVIAFTAKVAFKDYAEEYMFMVPVEENDNIFSVSEKITKMVDDVRNADKVHKEGANQALDIVGKLPNIIRVPLVGLLKWMDDKGCLPFGLEKDNLYYSSMIVSNLGSIKSDSIFHHISNFGTCSSLTTMGMIKDVEVLGENGKKEIRKNCDWGFSFDERVADGFYLIKSMEYVQHFFDHPETLEEPASKKYELEKK